ncbi:5029_t:CDS:2 [Dentiscutata heterogama]|uniref:5029_t:CDS:1 n=1 Tax=Dentiscutata heterogama TaxID=1316150 RepID=A0ACA9MAG8_9GLOM|nr:5029_t:CDS:2 [Dentiscutata heterogama]
MISTREIFTIPHNMGDKFAAISLKIKIYEQLQEWEIIFDKGQENLNEEQIKLKNAFLEADKIIPTQEYQDSSYIRQPISTELINTIVNIN